MARALTASLARSDVPGREALQRAVDGLKLGLALDEAYAPFATAGYLPCILDGEDAGFDLRFKDAAAAPGAARDVAMAFRWGGDPREEAAALAVCAALAGSFGALVRADEDETPLTAAELLDRARAALE